MRDVKVCDIEHQHWKNSDMARDYRATVGSLKEALKGLPNDAPIGVRFDGGYGYTDMYEILLTEGGLYIINCD